MPETLSELITLLNLEEIEQGLYRGRQPRTMRQRAFGGQVLAQALMAAARTTHPERSVHSIHAYFLRPGMVDAPIIYDVENSRDGGSFSSRRVLARQHGKIIFSLSGSFHRSEPGYDHQDVAPADVPDPQDCPPLGQILAQVTGRSGAEWEQEWGALDVRFGGDSRPGGELVDSQHPARARVWLRVRGDVGAEQNLRRAVLAYASDLTLLAVSTVPHSARLGSARIQAASLDHAMWFHRDVDPSEWLLYDQVSPSASGARGFAIGRLFANGTLVATATQEGLIRDVSASRPGRNADDN